MRPRARDPKEPAERNHAPRTRESSGLPSGSRSRSGGRSAKFRPASALQPGDGRDLAVDSSRIRFFTTLPEEPSSGTGAPFSERLTPLALPSVTTNLRLPGNSFTAPLRKSSATTGRPSATTSVQQSSRNIIFRTSPSLGRGAVGRLSAGPCTAGIGTATGVAAAELTGEEDDGNATVEEAIDGGSAREAGPAPGMVERSTR